MLKLRRLEISGFKSFVDPVSLQFAEGITAVVGPNGCGKSNISDAISWALGEQSAKSLRSGTMEDVIFNGAERRKPLGMAEVTLVLETDPSFEGAQEGEIVINRRVFRGGEGQYRLNGKRVRLKEIRDLLMGTGLGLRAYSIIEQGKIGLILSGKPQERRRLLEEASGITRYKERRRVAEVKLEEAAANLLRLDDIVSEVERAIRSLKRQSSAARRYKTKQAEHDETLERVLGTRWSLLRARLAVTDRALTDAVDRESELVAGLHREEADLARRRQSIDDLAEAVGTLHRKDAELGARIEGRQHLIKGARENIEQIAERLAAGRGLAEERLAAISRNQACLLALEDDAEALDEHFSSAQERFEGGLSELTERAESLREVEERLARLRSRLLDSTAEGNDLLRRIHAQQLEREKAAVRRSHLEEEIVEHGVDLTEASEAAAAAGHLVEELEIAVAEHAGAVATGKETLDALLQCESGCSVLARTHEDEHRTLTHRRQMLEELARAEEQDRQRLVEALRECGLDDPVFLADRITPPLGWERSLDFYLASLGDVVVVPDDVDPLSLTRQLATLDVSAALLAPVDEAPELAQVEDSAVVGCLGDVVDLPAAYRRALRPAYLLEDAAEAERVAGSYPLLDFVSHEQVWIQGGLFHLASARRQPGSLERQQELAALDDELPRCEDRVAQARVELDEAIARRTAQAQTIHSAEGRLTESQRELAVAQARREDSDERLRRLERQTGTFVEDQRDLEEQIEQLGSAAGELDRQLVEHQRLHAALGRDVDESVAAADRARDEREHLRTADAERRGELDLIEERRRGLRQEKDRLGREVEVSAEQQSRWQADEQRLGARRTDLEAAIGTAERELTSALEAQSSSHGEVVGEQQRLAEQRESLRADERAVESLRQQRENIREAVEAHRVDRARLESESQHLVEAFRDQLGREEPPEVVDEVSEEQLEGLESELADCKRILERLGPVNLLAAEEHGEQTDRHQHLVTQRTDVEQSVQNLRETIREINQTSSARFLETFEQVNVHFGTIFTELFGGGEAEMRLQDDDVLEAGIEIVARPPGKRLQNIMLLSGGEKALTAIALLMALFRTKPSPFCILDEVDAPLDDPNTVRFVTSLEKMATDTQFIVITHNKITMQAVTTLYGVTMQERCVSKTVTVTLDDVQPVEQERETA